MIHQIRESPESPARVGNLRWVLLRSVQVDFSTGDGRRRGVDSERPAILVPRNDDQALSPRRIRPYEIEDAAFRPRGGPAEFELRQNPLHCANHGLLEGYFSRL